MNALGDLKRQDRSARCDEAEAWYAKVLEKDPTNFDANYGSGACYLRSEKYDKAVALFTAALRTDPSSIDAKLALGETLLTVRKPAEALPLLEAAAAGDPQLRRLQFLLARAYRENGRQAEAKRAQQRYLELTQREEEQQPPPERPR